MLKFTHAISSVGAAETDAVSRSDACHQQTGTHAISSVGAAETAAGHMGPAPASAASDLLGKTSEGGGHAVGGGVEACARPHTGGGGVIGVGPGLDFSDIGAAIAGAVAGHLYIYMSICVCMHW